METQTCPLKEVGNKYNNMLGLELLFLQRTCRTTCRETIDRQAQEQVALRHLVTSLTETCHTRSSKIANLNSNNTAQGHQEHLALTQELSVA